MALSDCEKCWETPCECGYQYRLWSIEKLHEHIGVLQKVLVEKIAHDFVKSLQERTDNAI